MTAVPVRIFAVATFVVIGLSGCSRLPTVSSSPSHWPQTSGMSAEETRALREAEVAQYRQAPGENKSTSLASAALGTGRGGGVGAAAPKAPAPAAAQVTPSQAVPPASAATSSGRFAVDPDLLRPPSSARPAPAREMIASAAGSSGAAPQASRYGDLLFVSGQLPLDARGQLAGADVRMEEQARLALDNVRAVLEANRLTMANVVSMTVYLKDLNDMRAFDTVYASYFKGALPARSVVEVAKLRNNARIEISAVAGR